METEMPNTHRTELVDMAWELLELWRDAEQHNISTAPSYHASNTAAMDAKYTNYQRRLIEIESELSCHESSPECCSVEAVGIS